MYLWGEQPPRSPPVRDHPARAATRRRTANRHLRPPPPQPGQTRKGPPYLPPTPASGSRGPRPPRRRKTAPPLGSSSQQPDKAHRGRLGKLLIVGGWGEPPLPEPGPPKESPFPRVGAA
ncbi:formin-like protein 5 [Terrapene carolina triunguis]|uniref:formin-like protein 5 n=1 Tax=Terrapene triunguis TaxID=2587831 RepID=UPI000E77B7E4|nr:formin-like protein 5 [Terrapene carolina triunguis]